MITREFLDKQIRRIEKQTVKCVFVDEIFAQYSYCGEQEFADIITKVMKDHKYAGQFPVIGKFEDAKYEVEQERKQKEEQQRNNDQNRKFSEWVPATEKEKEESKEFVSFITEVRAWHYFSVQVNFTGEMKPLNKLTYENWKQLYIMADYDGWIVSGRPPLPCPICDYFFRSGERFYKRQIEKKDNTMQKYWLDCVVWLEERRAERVPESKGKKVPINLIERTL